jgi:sugar-specific transcriptional regulator TrmB
MDMNSLIECGLTENQAKLYVLLLKKPGLSAGEIAKELSIDRSFIYNIIESLTKKGLIYSSLTKKTKTFFPEKPKKIIEDIDTQKNKAKLVVKELEKIKEEEFKRSNIEIYEGKQAIRKYLSEIIDSNSFLTLGGGGKLNIFNILKYEYPHYLNKLKKSKVTGRIICSHNNKHFWESNLKNTPIEIKSLEGAGKETSITILKNRIIFSEETENPNITIMNNTHHAHSLIHYFNSLWKLAKP